MVAFALVLVLAAAPVETVSVDGVVVDVFTPSGAVKGDVLVLPGWDSTRADWCAKGGLCDEAEQRGLRLVMPEMGKSVYAAKIYPETRGAFRTAPTRTQLVDAIRRLQRERGLLADPGRSFVIGRSTGGRGAVLLALDHPEWFRAAASLSGDFDQTTMQRDGLMTSAYGPYAKFPERWNGSENEDNPQRRVAELAVPVYLGHGLKDAMVPPAQTRAFAEAAHVAAHFDDGGAHDHGYWRAELPRVFDFLAHAPDNVAAAAAAMTKLAALEGEWVATEAGKDSPASFTLDAKGTALVQRSGHLAVFARDGASITAHVWVDDGYSLWMRAVPRGATLAFRVVEVENASSTPFTAMLLSVAADAVVERWTVSGGTLDVNLRRAH